MAKFVANTAFDYTAFDVSKYVTNLLRWNYLDDVFLTVDEVEYSDASYATASIGGTSNLYLLGAGIKHSDWSLKPALGHVKALSEVTGGTFNDMDWLLSEVDVKVRLVAGAMATANTSDDMRLLSILLAGDDKAELSEDSDAFCGFAGNDTIDALGGDDTILGGYGGDEMTGGDGADVFVFDDRHAGLGLARDIITDFETGVDMIDLSAIDANTRKRGDQAFTFTDTTATKNSVWIMAFDGTTVVVADVNGDKRADMMIHLLETTVSAADLVL